MTLNKQQNGSESGRLIFFCFISLINSLLWSGFTVDETFAEKHDFFFFTNGIKIFQNWRVRALEPQRSHKVTASQVVKSPIQQKYFSFFFLYSKLENLMLLFRRGVAQCCDNLWQCLKFTVKRETNQSRCTASPLTEWLQWISFSLSAITCCDSLDQTFNCIAPSSPLMPETNWLGAKSQMESGTLLETPVNNPLANLICTSQTTSGCNRGTDFLSHCVSCLFTGDWKSSTHRKQNSNNNKTRVWSQHKTEQKPI